MMLLLQVMMVSIFKLNITNFVNIKISLMLLLQVMKVAMFKYPDEFTDSPNFNDATLARNDGHYIQACQNQAHNKNFDSQMIIDATLASDDGRHIQAQ